MDMSLMAVDVDGSFANPVMQVAVIVYALVLATILIIIFCFIASRWQRIGSTVGIATFGCVSSPFVNRLFGMWLYSINAKPNVSVGFIGGPPFWLSTLFAFAFAGIGTLMLGRVRAVRGIA